MVADAQKNEVTVKLFQTSDIHGNYFPYDFITNRPWGGSLSRVAAAVKKARKIYGDNVILLDNGDILQGQPSAYYYNYEKDNAPHLAAEMLNYMQYDAGNIGNHDVETGMNVLKRFASECKFPMLGANIIDTISGVPHFTPYVVLERSGIKIAVLGLITPAIPAWLPKSLWGGLRFEDMQEAAEKWIPIIKERENPDVIVGLFHAGKKGNVLAGYKENPSMEIAREVPGFDIVLMGHDHIRECKRITNVNGDTVLVMNPASNGIVLTDIDIKVKLDSLGNVVDKNITGTLIPMEEYNPDPFFMKHFSRNFKEVKEYVATPIGNLSKSISTRGAFFGDSEFIDLIHELQLGITGADISFAAPLSYDAGIDSGMIKMSDMFSLYKFENLLYVMNLTGKEIKDYLEMSYDIWTNKMTSADDHLLLFKEIAVEGDENRSVLKNPSYNFDSAAGIIYEVDVTKPKGEKITIKSMADGSEFREEAVYKVALNSYRGNGGGELLTEGAGIPHSELPSRVVFSTDRDMRHYLADYIHKQGSVLPKKLGQWKFVPENLVAPAIERDKKLLFNE